MGLGSDASPDIADALAVTFAQDVSDIDFDDYPMPKARVKHEFNPLDAA